MSRRSARIIVGLVALLGSGVGCMHKQPVPLEVPKELNKVNHPPYMIEPPDILEIDLVQAVPNPGYKLRVLDVVGIRITDLPADWLLDNAFTVDPDGNLNFNLGKAPRKVRAEGKTTVEVENEIKKDILKEFQKYQIEVALLETRAFQQIRGRHIVRSDGVVNLGEYGTVYVSGMTLTAAKKEIETNLAKFLKDPQVNIDVGAFNSKVYYVILDLGGAGQQVYRQPITGNETVLDGISQVNGLTIVSDTKRIWVSRPGPDGCSSVLPVDWVALTEKGDPGTNYQLLPGDRIFVKAYPMIRVDTTLARVIGPFERLFGVTLLGNSVSRSFRSSSSQSQNSFP